MLKRYAAIVIAMLVVCLPLPLQAFALKSEPAGESLEALIRDAARQDAEQRTLREAGYIKLEPEGFFLLCAKGSAAEVRKALMDEDNPVDPNAQDPERGGTTALQDAARSNPDPEVIRILIKAGANPDAQGQVYKRTALHLAVMYNPDPVPVIKALLQNGANPDLYDFTPWTPLQNAINGRVHEQSRRFMGPENDIILTLVEGGASMNKGSGRNYTPLGHYLSKFGLRGALASNNARLDLRVVRAMIKAGADVNAQEVASFGNTDSPLLHLAVRIDSNHEKAVDTLTQIFLEAGANPWGKSWRGKTALHGAAFFGNIKAAKLLLKNAGGNLASMPDEHGETPLHTLAKFPSPRLPEFGTMLLKSGANINAADERGQSAMHCLANSAKQLERRSLEMPGSEDFAAQQKTNLLAAEFLLASGAKFLPDQQGAQPIHELCDGPALPRELLAVFTKAGADINAIDAAKETPLIKYAAAASAALQDRQLDGSREDAARYRARLLADVRFLIQNGADPDLRDATGQTAYEKLAPDVLEKLEELE